MIFTDLTTTEIPACLKDSSGDVFAAYSFESIAAASLIEHFDKSFVFTVINVSSYK